MFLTLFMWNTDGVGSKERELMELVWKTSPDMFVLTERKNTSLLRRRRVWPGAKLEAIPSKRKEVRSAPRDGLAILVGPGLKYYVQFVRDDIEDETNDMV